MQQLSTHNVLKANNEADVWTVRVPGGILDRMRESFGYCACCCSSFTSTNPDCDALEPVFDGRWLLVFSARGKRSQLGAWDCVAGRKCVFLSNCCMASDVQGLWLVQLRLKGKNQRHHGVSVKV